MQHITKFREIELEIFNILYNIIYCIFLAQTIWKESINSISQIIIDFWKILLLTFTVSLGFTALNWLLFHSVFNFTNINLFYYFTFVITAIIIAYSVKKILKIKFVKFYKVLKPLALLLLVDASVYGVAIFEVIPKADFILSMFCMIGCNLGWGIRILAFVSIRKRLYFSNIPKLLDGVGIVIIITGFYFLASMGFIGIL